MQTGDFMEVTVEMTLPNASNPCINVWNFECLTASDTNGLQAIGDDIIAEFISRYYAPMGAVISSQAAITGVRLRNLNLEIDGYDKFGVLWSGANNSGMLPPFVTLSIREIRTDFSMRNGRKGIGGVAIPVCDSTGKVSASTLTLFDDIFDGWSTTDFNVEAGEADYTFGDVVIRKSTVPNTPPTKYYLVQNYTMSTKFGTQNSRK